MLDLADMEVYHTTVLRSTHLVAGVAACAAVASYMLAPQACNADEASLKVGAVLAVASTVPAHLRASSNNTSMTRAVSVAVAFLASCVLSKSAAVLSGSCSDSLSAAGRENGQTTAATAAWFALVASAICESAVCFLNVVTPSDESARTAAVVAVGGVSMPSVARKFGARPLLPTARTSYAARATVPTPSMAYVPDGLSKDEWKKIQQKEKEKKKGLGRAGPRGYKSRSFKSFQESLERGEAKHLFPVDPKKVKSGEIPIEDVPYMQRGGSWDGSDLKGGQRKRALKKGYASPWLKSDKEYAAGGYKKDQSVSVFGGDALPWTNRQQARPKSAEEYEEKKKKGPFGLW